MCEKMKKEGKFFLLILILLLGVMAGCSHIKDNNTKDKKKLQINVKGEGAVNPSEGTYRYEKDKKIILEAKRTNSKWKFKRWEGSINRTESPTKVVMDSDLGITAVFEREAFKLVNSWGKNWGPYRNGTLYMTYDAAIENNISCFVVEPRNDYEPKAIALFKMDHPDRGDWVFRIHVEGRSNNADKYFYPSVYKKGGNHLFPDNKLAIDITELMPFEGENIELEVTNYGGSLETTGTLESFEIQIYNDYSAAPVKTYTSPDSQLTISTAGEAGAKKAVIKDVTASSSTTAFKSGVNTFSLKNVSKPLTKGDIKRLSRKSDGNYNELINGHGTGWKPLTEGKLQETLEKGNIRKLDSQKIIAAASDSNEIVDHSESKYFPPIGDQGREGSCTAWSVAYYTQSFYEAKDCDWDLSSMPNDSKLMSPEFVYHLINGGKDNGSSFVDAIKLIENIGVASLEKMPYSDQDHTSWPSKAAFKEAPKFRSKRYSKEAICYYLQVTNERDIKAIKELLRQGYLITVGIDAYEYEDLTADGVWTTDNYQPQEINHANTIVGFYD